MNKLAEDKELREKLGRNAAVRVKKYFSEKEVIKSLYEALSE